MMDLNGTASTQGVLGSFLRSASAGDIFVASVAALLIPVGLVIIHRLYIHPLRNIPGPWLAAVTNAYGLYYNQFQGGYSKRFAHLHEKYSMSIPVSVSGRNVFSR